MTREEQKLIEKDAVETYGMDSQMRMLQEECGELIVAVGHYLRGREGSIANLCEELADVKIMVEQMEIALDNPVIEELYDYKLGRLKKRLEEHKSIG
jgi:NTP pyrophosphatase (non-canonical NTP hydrolase)